MNRAHYRDAVKRAGVFTALAEFDPHIAGTLPLNIDLPTSDIDILCHAPVADRFASTLWAAFSSCPDFRIWQWSGHGRPVLASFTAHGWPFEIFGHASPVSEQAGWRHFTVEKRLLALGGQRLADAVMGFRRNGLKTELAFAAALGLRGDPYRALLEIHDWNDDALARLIGQGGR